MEVFIAGPHGIALIPTNGDHTLALMGVQAAATVVVRTDVEGNFDRVLAQVPTVAQRVAAATRVEPFRGAGVRNYFRKPYGPGWVLVGDAGYNNDPITAQGISDAFVDAERVASALDSVFLGRSSFDAAMADYQQARDEHAWPIYEFTTQMATLEPPPPDLQEILTAVARSQPAMDGFVSVMTGTMSPAEFFAPEHLGPLLATAN